MINNRDIVDIAALGRINDNFDIACRRVNISGREIISHRERRVFV